MFYPVPGDGVVRNLITLEVALVFEVAVIPKVLLQEVMLVVLLEVVFIVTLVLVKDILEVTPKLVELVLEFVILNIVLEVN